MLQNYFKNLYKRTMQEAYSFAHQEIVNSLRDGGNCLDCGASHAQKYQLLKETIDFAQSSYFGVEWNEDLVLKARKKNINLVQGDLNKELQFPDNKFKCVFGLSVLEHLLNPCRYLKECYRVLEDEGNLIILTPNISTYFTALLILLGKMPSSGPHPDSDQLVRQEEIIKVSNMSLQPDTEIDTPVHRHLIVFSYRVLISYCRMIGFREVKGYGFGLYPFPSFMQPVLERIDPYHCHQMVIVARK
ncbi:MAG: methyltransferase domain-containing protein [Pseudomonadota bacterium]|nr:methyltransferase domain-containing protein [Pseudomonadota bacterium]